MKASNPIFDMDVTKYMAQFKLPTVDTDALMASYRKNVEALTAANQCALEGVGALVRRQSEIAREAVESYSRAVGDLIAEGTVEEKAARQADLARQAYERAVANARELGDMVAKTSNEAFGLLNDRIRESFGEVQEFVAAGAARAADPAERGVKRAGVVAEQAAKTAEDAGRAAAQRK